MTTQPLLPPFQRHSDTSHMAAIAMMPKAGTKRRIVLDYLRLVHPTGATDEEGMRFLRMEGNTYRPRRDELVKAGMVIDSGERRSTRSGQLAVVWVIKT